MAQRCCRGFWSRILLPFQRVVEANGAVDIGLDYELFIVDNASGYVTAVTPSKRSCPCWRLPMTSTSRTFVVSAVRYFEEEGLLPARLL